MIKNSNLKAIISGCLEIQN